MRLNADIGEHFGDWSMGNDEAIMPLIHQANIACGYHAGDAMVMQLTLSLAKQHEVEAGAHVAYPDLQGFGRRSMQLGPQQLYAMIQAQIAVLEGLAMCQGIKLHHVKPHGALYNDMMKDEGIFDTVAKAVGEYHHKLPLVIQALANNKTQQDIAARYGVPLVLEVFADRAYTDSGLLMSRTQPGSVLNEDMAYQQARAFIFDKGVTTANGKWLSINADTLCVHSDSPDAIALCEKISLLISSSTDNV